MEGRCTNLSKTSREKDEVEVMGSYESSGSISGEILDYLSYCHLNCELPDRLGGPRTSHFMHCGTYLDIAYSGHNDVMHITYLGTP
jgi:hypothetical protein